MVVPPKSSILIGFSIIFTIHFGVYTTIFRKHPYVSIQYIYEVIGDAS